MASHILTRRSLSRPANTAGNAHRHTSVGGTHCTHCVNRRNLGAAFTGFLIAPALLPFAGQAKDAPPTPASSQFEADVDNFVQQTQRAETMDPKQLQTLRETFGFRRSPTGKVQLRSKAGTWYDVRLDMQLPGVCMIRSPSGDIYILQLENIQQIDLSNDLIVMSVFGDAGWEDALEPLEFGEGNGQLNMGAVEFRESLGILSDALQVASALEEARPK